MKSWEQQPEVQEEASARLLMAYIFPNILISPKQLLLLLKFQ
jgi:hypothetical protein